MSTLNPDQFTSYISVHFTNPVFYSQAPYYAPPQHPASKPLAGGSSMQPFSRGVEDTQWEARTTPHSSTEEDDENKDETESRDEDEHEGRSEDEEDEKDNHHQQ
ncbi:hypothetical protein PVK06_026216 [Gossypium arboreum]|uniref:Uncharacterized protein n=1 Tax=Gossypium arboreum TaxID=29729 RepID=A0ABR0NYB5_GOSAR|nr:hypothetical protein PVK06_026216 [Gossypium arboreum]